LQKRSNHNSILFLTTLSVYLGLLLVGAPTGVLGQPAAMSRNFDISEEFEIADDLDNKPDDTAVKADSVTVSSLNYSATVANLLKQFRTTPSSLSSFPEPVSIISTRKVPAKILPIHFQAEPQQTNTEKYLLIGTLPRSGIDPLSAFSA